MYGPIRLIPEKHTAAWVENNEIGYAPSHAIGINDNEVDTEFSFLGRYQRYLVSRESRVFVVKSRCETTYTLLSEDLECIAASGRGTRPVRM